MEGAWVGQWVAVISGRSQILKNKFLAHPFFDVELCTRRGVFTIPPTLNSSCQVGYNDLFCELANFTWYALNEKMYT